jgi:hypothetical protein
MTNKEARLKLQTLYRCRCLLTGIKTDKQEFDLIEQYESECMPEYRKKVMR